MSIENNIFATYVEQMKYLKKLEGKVYKILPIFEGRDSLTKQVVYEKNEALKLYESYLNKLGCNISGYVEMVKNHITNETKEVLQEILLNVRGLSSITEHKYVRSIVLTTIGLIQQLGE